jgi:hypothetical protein
MHSDDMECADDSENDNDEEEKEEKAEEDVEEEAVEEAADEASEEEAVEERDDKDDDDGNEKKKEQHKKKEKDEVDGMSYFNVTFAYVNITQAMLRTHLQPLYLMQLQQVLCSTRLSRRMLTASLLRLTEMVRIHTLYGQKICCAQLFVISV